MSPAPLGNKNAAGRTTGHKCPMGCVCGRHRVNPIWLQNQVPWNKGNRKKSGKQLTLFHSSAYRPLSEDHRTVLSKAHMGPTGRDQSCPSGCNCGRHDVSRDTRETLSMIGKQHWIEMKAGLSPVEAYSQFGWSTLAEMVREAFSRVCMMCFQPEESERLTVHHVDWNHDNMEWDNLIPVHRSCHGFIHQRGLRI